MSLFFWFVRCTRAELEKEKFVKFNCTIGDPGRLHSWIKWVSDALGCPSCATTMWVFWGRTPATTRSRPPSP